LKKLLKSTDKKPTVSSDDSCKRKLNEYKQPVTKGFESFMRFFRKQELGNFLPRFGKLIALIRVKLEASMQNQSTISSLKTNKCF